MQTLVFGVPLPASKRTSRPGWSAEWVKRREAAGSSRAQSWGSASFATTSAATSIAAALSPRSTRWRVGSFPRCRRGPYRRWSCRTTRRVRRRCAWWRLDGGTQSEATLFDVGRYEVRPDHVAARRPSRALVYGGKVRPIMIYLDRVKLQSPRPFAAGRPEGRRRIQRLPAGRQRQVRHHRLRDRQQLDVRRGRSDERDPPAQSARQRCVPAGRGDPRRMRTSSRPTSCESTANGRCIFRYSASLLGTLDVVDTLKATLDTITARLTRPGIDLKIVLDQSVYVRHSIQSLVEEGVLGAVLCSW